MTTLGSEPEVVENAPVATWFGVGGGADLLARPRTAEDVARCVREHAHVRVLGDGANLLVADRGVDGLVIDLERLDAVSIDGLSGAVRAGAGVNLPRLINQTVRAGLGGLEILAGIPASVGGAVFMNAGGKFGSISDAVSAVEIVLPDGTLRRCVREEIGFGYRRSGLLGVVVGVEFELRLDDPVVLRERLKSCMAYKKSTQPLGADSAGCCFKNPTLRAPIEGIGEAGARVGAGLLLDRAGCKGMRRGGAVVSDAHANFLVSGPGATASDLIGLMGEARDRVADVFGVELEREVVVWERDA